MASFGERLRTLRKQMGKSQAEFADLLGISLGSQGLYERDEVEPSAAYFLKLGALNVDMNFLCASGYAPDAAAKQFTELLAVLYNLPPTQQAMGFAILNILQQGAAGNGGSVQTANETWRAGRLVGQFLAASESGKAVVEVAAKGALIDLPPK